MSELALPSGLIIPRPQVELPSPGLLLPGAQQLLRRPLERWKRHRTAADVIAEAVTVDQGNIGTDARAGAATSIVTTTAAVAPGAMIAILCGRFNGTVSSTLTASSSPALTWAQAHTLTSGNYRLSLFYAFAPSGLASGSTLTVTAAPLAGNNDFTTVAASYLGVDSAAAPVALNGAAASTANWSSSTVAAGAGNLLIGGAAADVGGTSRSSTATAGTERIDFYSSASGGVVTLVDKLSAAASDSLAGTWSAAFAHIGLAVAFQAAAGGGATPNPPARARLLIGRARAAAMGGFR